jgi:peptide/nickel transport system substrate-binding protein
VRFDNWKSGRLPKIRRVIARDVPSPGTRRAMLERGDADISTGFPPKDFDQMIKEGKLKVVGVPIPNALWYVALNTSRPPFDNVKLRQAIAWAMPYEQIQSSAFFGRARPMYGGGDTVEQAAWPQPFPYRTDLDKAKALMQEAGFAQGLDTSFALDVGTATVGEPTAVLIQESLAKIGVRITIEKIPGANWRTTLNKKELPMVLNRFSGWLDYPEYYFFWNFHGNNSIFNISAYKNAAMDQLIDRARFTDDEAEYEKSVKEVIALCMQDVPIVPLNQPIHDIAMQKAVGGYEFWFHREPDFRQFSKA